MNVFLKIESDPDDSEPFRHWHVFLHVIHCGFKMAHNACGWEVHVFLQSLHYLFKDFPSRCSDFTAASQSSIFPFWFCSIRWVEPSAVVRGYDERGYDVTHDCLEEIANCRLAESLEVIVAACSQEVRAAVIGSAESPTV